MKVPSNACPHQITEMWFLNKEAVILWTAHACVYITLSHFIKYNVEVVWTQQTAGRRGIKEDQYLFSVRGMLIRRETVHDDGGAGDIIKAVLILAGGAGVALFKRRNRA